ncbi:CLOCK-interacting pacemaker-like [Hippocampus comes]|uniref:CLOCK-interacting pacemaker-like n=1 Tax=Hippocampus comes TaxID=109280 RepID=UPI00094E1E91|nr:PREDICTED: CLOCK-interacting pacemaker-like [Hippocampus comes]
MVKEELVMGECSSPLASSKNAKEKSNSSTLRAMRKNKDSDDRSERGSRCSSEKDSGYSDNCADWQQTDADQQSNKHQAREAGAVLGFVQSQDCGKGKPGDPKWMPRGQAIQPIYILNHRALKQTEAIPKSARRFWTKSSSDVAGSDGAHRIFFQQPSLMPAALRIHKPFSQKNSTSGKKVTPYLPILDSYPRIAPHPSKKPPDKSVLSDGVQNFSKRVCTEQKGDLEPVARSQQPAISALRRHPSSSSSPTREPSNSAPRSPPTSALTNGGPQRSGSVRHRRFSRRDPSARLSETQRQNCAGVEPRREFLSRETSPEKVTFVPPDSSTG